MAMTGWQAVVLGTAAVGQMLFVLMYVALPWWRSLLGRALFFKASGFAAALNTAVVGYLWDWRHEAEVFLGVYIVLAVGVWGQFIAFVITKRTHDQEVSGNRGSS